MPKTTQRILTLGGVVAIIGALASHLFGRGLTGPVGGFLVPIGVVLALIGLLQIHRKTSSPEAMGVTLVGALLIVGGFIFNQAGLTWTLVTLGGAMIISAVAIYILKRTGKI
jgi:hypothetical protein